MTRVGLALGRDLIVAWSAGQARRLGPDLREALTELRALEGRRRTLHVAVLPPLVEIKRLEFPPLRRGQIEAVLARDAERHFIGASGEQVVSAVRIARNTVLAAAMPAELVERIFDEARSMGWSVAALVPAHVAWVESARLGQRGAAGCLLVPWDGAMELLVVRAGRLAMTRRLRVGHDAVLADRVAVACRGHGALRHLGSLSPGLRAELEVRDVPLIEEQDPPASESPEVLAARFAAASTWLELVPDSARSAAGRKVRRLTRGLFAAAATLAFAAAGLEWWGTVRELDRIAAARAGQRKQVAEALAVRAALEQWDGRLAVLRDAEAGAVRWSAVLAGLADHLPTDARITALRGTSDSVILEGEAREAAASFEALRQSPGIAGLKAMAPIRQESGDSGPPVERFVLGAVLRADFDPGGVEP